MRAGQRGSQVNGEVFNISLDYGTTYEEVTKAASKAAGFPNAPMATIPATEGWNKIQDISIVLSSRKAEQLLGWRAKHVDFIEQMDIYYQAWKASQ